MALILDGKSIAQDIREQIRAEVSALPSKPGLAVILVGENPASQTYVSLKQKACEEAGMYFEKFQFGTDVSENELIEKIQTLNNRKDIHGILVQLPLPNQNADRVIESIDPQKDVDGFHPKNLEALRMGKPTTVSAVALGIMKLLEKVLSQQSSSQWNAVIVASALFAEPIQLLLSAQHISSLVVNPNQTNIQNETSRTDILVIAAGIPKLITKDMIKPGAILIDVGTTKVNGKLVGDIDQASVEPIAGALTPVPGGVGPMTVAMLLSNVLLAYKNQNNRN